mmetsp:Transcript_28538/g.32616  ORF Transcript_28538/g.32616 Transcript_28538/m.32616 type:complete len:246 (-) Transcript_28538:454-1191(-)
MSRVYHMPVDPQHVVLQNVQPFFRAQILIISNAVEDIPVSPVLPPQINFDRVHIDDVVKDDFDYVVVAIDQDRSDGTVSNRRAELVHFLVHAFESCDLIESFRLFVASLQQVLNEPAVVQQSDVVNERQPHGVFVEGAWHKLKLFGIFFRTECHVKELLEAFEVCLFDCQGKRAFAFVEQVLHAFSFFIFHFQVEPEVLLVFVVKLVSLFCVPKQAHSVEERLKGVVSGVYAQLARAPLFNEAIQ